MNATRGFIYVLLLLFSSCGKDEKDTSKESAMPEVQQEEIIGEYRAVLQTINPNILRNKSFGTATIHIDKDNIQVKLNLIKTPGGVRHMQSIHSIGGCPDQLRDKNNDSFVDVIEGMTDYGNILIPLDGDISTYDLGQTYSPSSDSSGHYVYKEQAALISVLTDLKLRMKENLNLTNRSFVVMGVNSNYHLPDTVATIQDLPSEATIPIACGKIIKILNEGQD